MPSYTQYMRQMAVMDASDDDIESWITVRGNHIPIKKGQSKEDAVKSFIEKKGGNTSKGSNQKNELSVIYHKDKGHIKEGRPPKDWSKVEGALTAPNGYSWYSNNKSMFGGERESYLYKDEPNEKKNTAPKNTFLSNPNTLKEFANHFGISESAAKNAAEKYGDEFYNTMVKDPMKGVGMAVGGEKKENGRYERPVHISEPLKDVVSETKAKMEKKEPHYFYKWTIESEKPHNLTNEQIQEKLNFYRFVRSNGRSDDNELLDKIHDLSDELERRKK